MKIKFLNTIFYIVLSFIFINNCKQTPTTQEETLKKIDGVIVQLSGIVLTAKDVKLPIEKWEPVKMREVVSEGVYIRTRTNSSCDIMLKNGTVIKLIENTILLVSKLVGNENITQSKFNLEGGSVFTKASRLVGDSTFSITTPTAVAGIRGTEFVVEYNEGKTNIAVSQGKVAVIRNIEIDASKPLTPQTEQVINAINEPVEITQGQAVDVSNQQNIEIEQTIQRTQQGEQIEVDKIRTRGRLSRREANQNENKNFLRFRELRNLPSEEKENYGVLLIFGGNSTEIYINNELIGNDMLMRVTKIGQYKIKIVKQGSVIKEDTIEVKSKQKTIVKIAEPAFTTPERSEEQRRIQRVRERVFGDDRVRRRRNVFEEGPGRVFRDSTRNRNREIDVFQDQQRGRINRVDEDLDQRVRNRDARQNQEQRDASRQPGRSNYGTEGNTVERLRQRQQQRQERGRTNLNRRRMQGGNLQENQRSNELEGSAETENLEGTVR